MSITTDALRAAQAIIDLDRQIAAQSMLVEALSRLQAQEACESNLWMNPLWDQISVAPGACMTKEDFLPEVDDDQDFGDPLDWPEWTDEFSWNLTEDPIDSMASEDIRRWETRIAREFEMPLKPDPRTTSFGEWLLDRRDPE